MGGLSDANTNRVVEAVESYLSRNPDAADSVRGIAEWWLPAMGVESDSEALPAALVLLEQMGVVERRVLSDGQVIYRAAKAGRDGADTDRPG